MTKRRETRSGALFLGLALSAIVGGCATQRGADDRTVNTRVVQRIDANPTFQHYEVDAHAVDNVVTLRGEVEDRTQRTAAEKITRETRGVDEVQNMLMVRHDPQRDAAQRAVGNRMLASKVAARLAADRALRPHRILVEVDDGEVTLRGSVNDPDLRERAEQIAFDTDGVESVTNDLRTRTTP